MPETAEIRVATERSLLVPIPGCRRGRRDTVEIQPVANCLEHETTAARPARDGLRASARDVVEHELSMDAESLVLAHDERLLRFVSVLASQLAHRRHGEREVRVLVPGLRHG